MRLYVTFFRYHKAFSKQELPNGKIPLVGIPPGTYFVTQSDTGNFYRFTHTDFYFEFAKSLWNSPDFLKRNEIQFHQKPQLALSTIVIS